MSQIESLTYCLALSFISWLFGDQFGRSLQFCHLEFDKKAISGGFMEHFHVFTSGEGDEF